MIYKIILIIVFQMLFFTSSTYGQYIYGTTGLLQMPSADMQHDKTVILGGSVLNPSVIPSKEWWGNYYTLNYYLNATIFPWLEIGYNCVLVKAKPDIYHWAPSTYGKFVNQDRSFHVRLRVWKKGWWKKWTPQIVVGINDPQSGSWKGGTMSREQRTNGFFCRYYVAATKYIDFGDLGHLGTHIAYVWNMKRINEIKEEVRKEQGICVGINYNFNLSNEDSFVSKAINRLNLIVEYDSESINAGFHYAIWKDCLNVIFEMNEMEYPSGGLLFKIHLK